MGHSAARRVQCLRSQSATSSRRPFLIELEHEVLRKALQVALHLLNQAFRFHAVEICQILVEHHLPSPDDEDPPPACPACLADNLQVVAAKREPDLGPLPGGHHGLSPEQVAESQRERLIAAIASVVAERGYRASTIAEIVRAASVSSRAFYENFESKEACFLAAFEAVLAHLEELVAAAVAPVPDWPGRVAAGPALARLCLVEPITASPQIATRFRAVVVACIPHLRAGRAERPEAAALPDSTEDSLLGGLLVLTARSLLAGGPLTDLLPDLVEFALSPYLGPERAKELAREATGLPAS